MFFRIIFLVFICLLTACVKKDAHYYWQHPDKLQAVLAECPAIQQQGIDCHALGVIQKTMLTLANELQQNPQRFGNKIIQLQEKIAMLKTQIEKNRDDQTLHKTLSESRIDLQQRMAIVKWLESPGG